MWAGLTLIGLAASTKADLTLGATIMVTGAGLAGALIPGVRHRPGRVTRQAWSGLFALGWSLFALWQMVGLLIQPDNSWHVTGQVAISQSDVTAAVFSNDGSQLALGATDGTVTVWITQDGKPGIELAGQTAPIQTIAFARDGSLIAASACEADCTQPRIGWWQASDGQLIHMEAVTGTAVTDLAFTPERSILAIGVCRQSTDTALCREGEAQLWSTINPTFLDTRPGVGVALSPNMAAPLLASAEKDTVVVRQLLTNAVSYTLPMSETINHLIFSPDGKWLAANGDRLTRVWRVVDGAPAGDFSRSTASTSNVSFSPDGRLMAQIDGTAIKVWQVADHALRRELLTPYVLYAVAFAPDGTLLSYAATDHTILRWWVGK